MNTQRTPRRFRYLMFLAPVIALALGSFWLLEVMRRADNEFVPTQQRTEPDFYVEKFSYVRISKTGQAQYHFSGEKLTHNPQDDSYDIMQPKIVHAGNSQAPTTIRADRAHVNSDNSQVNMYNNVHLDRPASASSQPMQVKSEHMLLLPDDDVVKTDKPVEIRFGQSILVGTGMYANNATREFRLSSNVHGTYQAPAR